MNVFLAHQVRHKMEIFFFLGTAKMLVGEKKANKPICLGKAPAVRMIYCLGEEQARGQEQVSSNTADSNIF